MAQTPGVPLTAAALLCTGFLVGSHPLVTSHPLLRGLTPGVADASPATTSASMVSCPNVVATPTPAPLPARLAALQNAELEEQARRAARRDQRATAATPPTRALPFVPGSIHPNIEEMLTRMTMTPEGRRHFETWLERRLQYQTIISEALARHGLPAELEAVAFIESDLVPTAISRVGASGLWQFMPETARAYGLTVEPGYDERRHVLRASEAAAQYLADLHDHFGTWELALAAYNSGFGRMQRVVESAGSSDFWALAEADNAIPSTTPQYVARVLAAAHVLKRLSSFGFRTPDTSVEETDTLIVPSGAAVWQVARAAGMSEPELRTLNPEILGDVFPDVEYELSVLLPRERTERARIMIPLLVADASEEMSSEAETAIR